MKDGRFLLLHEITERRTRNPSYSLRAFARDLGVSPAALSQYLNRKRELSPKNRRNVIERLHLSPGESEVMLKTEAGIRAPSKHVAKNHDILHDEAFQMISDWVSLAIMNLARLKKNRAKADWIAERLGLPVHEVKEVFDRLLRFGLIKEKNGRMERTSRPFMTSTDVPSAAIRRFHAGLLRRAEEALLNTSVSDRDITAITMPASPAKLDQAKKILRSTRHRISKLMDTDDNTEVFVLSMQLFPVTKGERSST